MGQSYWACFSVLTLDTGHFSPAGCSGYCRIETSPGQTAEGTFQERLLLRPGEQGDTGEHFLSGLDFYQRGLVFCKKNGSLNCMSFK